MSRIGRASATQKSADSRREFLRSERFREVVVGSGFESGDHVVRVGASRHHHDRDVAAAPQGSAQLESVDARKHDVDQDDVGRLAEKDRHRFFTTRRLVDQPALVLEGQSDRSADAFVVLDGEDAGSHTSMLPEIERESRLSSSVLGGWLGEQGDHVGVKCRVGGQHLLRSRRAATEVGDQGSGLFGHE